MTSDLDTRIDVWRTNCARKLCSTCPDSCCNGYKHRIDMTNLEVAPFTEHGIPIVRLHDLDTETALRNGYLNFNGRVLKNNQKPLEKPSLVEMLTTFGRNDSGELVLASVDYTLYVSKFCPMYKDGRCIIHEDTRRPKVCKAYPIFKTQSKGENVFLYAKSCKPFNNPDIRKEFDELFSAHIIISLSYGDYVKLN